MDEKAFLHEYCLHSQFEKQVLRTPDNIALEDGSRSITYKELNQYANKTAQNIIKEGFKKNDRIGLYMKHCIELPVMVLAVLKAGCTCVPIDPAFPENRVKRIIKSCRIKAVFADETLDAEGKFGDEINVRTVRDFRECDMEEWAENPQNDVCEQDIAFIFNTSGTSDEPKAVELSHKACCFIQMPENTYCRLNEDDKVLFMTPISFAGLKGELFWPWFAGAGIFVIEPNGNRNAEYLTYTILNRKITTVTVLTSMLREILKKIEDGKKTALRNVFCIAEQFDYKVAEHFYQIFPDVNLYNLYGQTEASPTSVWLCEKTGVHGRGLIGKTVKGVTAYIINDKGKQAAAGEEGELYISGVTLASGYSNYKELYNEKFIYRRDITDEKLYRTGDAAIKREDGNLELIGRIDHLIKINGISVNPLEVESVLNGFDGIEDAAVTSIGDSHKKLIAFIKPKQGCPVSQEDLLEYLNTQVPQYMVPVDFYLISDMPYAHSGKKEYKKLAEQREKLQKVSRNLKTPQTIYESKIAEFVRNQLEIDEIGMDDSYFQKGGDSMSAASLVCLLEEEFDVNLDMADFLTESISVRVMADIISKLKEGEHL